MTISLPEEAIQLREVLRKFVDDIIEPWAEEIDSTNDIPEEIFDRAAQIRAHIRLVAVWKV